MSILNSFKYFFFLATNWNVRIAWVLVTTDRKGDRKYGINTTGAKSLNHLKKAEIDVSHSTIYMPASFPMLELFFTKADTRNCKHFLDIGCGKGRALIMAAEAGTKKITGVDISRQLLDSAKKNIAKYNTTHQGIDFIIKHDDAFYFEIADDVDIIFLFNPFDEFLMEAVADNIEKSLAGNPRQLQIVYFNPLHKHVFLNRGFEQIFHWQKMIYLEGVILKNQEK